MSDVKVTIEPTTTPSQELIAKAAQTVTVTDSKGRVIVLRKPGPLAQFRFIEMLGNDTAKNEVYVNMTLPLLFIGSIDGEPELPPTSKRQLEALIQRLDEEGVSAVLDGVREKFGSTSTDEDRAALKN